MSETIYKLQPSAHADWLTADGVELTKLPYPFFVRADGSVLQPHGFREVIGFAERLDVEAIDLWWGEAIKDLSAAVGMYLVTENDEGVMAMHLTAIESTEEIHREQAAD